MVAWSRAHVLFFIYHLNYGVIQGFPALRKVVTTHEKKYDNFLRVFDITNQLLSLTFRATRSG